MVVQGQESPVFIGIGTDDSDGGTFSGRQAEILAVASGTGHGDRFFRLTAEDAPEQRVEQFFHPFRILSKGSKKV